MELQLHNATQHVIANLLWVAETQQDINSILDVFGHDGHVVYNMMLAAAFDEVDEVHDAADVIRNISSGNQF